MNKRGFSLIGIVYVFLAVTYAISIKVDSGITPSFLTITLNYVLKAILTLPIWYLIFNILGDQPIGRKAMIHPVTLTIFIWIWGKAYFTLCEYFGFFYVKGAGQIWDYYLTGIFYLIQFGIFHIYDYYSKLQSKELIISQQNQLQLQSELTALKAQLNPHFLYNVFNTINASVPTKAEKTRNMIAQLSDLFRYQLKASKEEWVTVKEEIDFVKKYLDLEKERFGKRLTHEINIGDGLREVLIPPLIIQPIVENAVKHGISPLITGGKVDIAIEKKGEELDITISDTGAGIASDEKEKIWSKGVGLSNTHKRLEKMYGKGLEIADNEPNGLIVTLSIQLKKTEVV